jgi:hypothetical protein
MLLSYDKTPHTSLLNLRSTIPLCSTMPALSLEFPIVIRVIIMLVTHFKCTKTGYLDVDEIRIIPHPYPNFPNRTETHSRREPHYVIPNILANIYLLKNETVTPSWDCMYANATNMCQMPSTEDDREKTPVCASRNASQDWCCEAVLQ